MNLKQIAIASLLAAPLLAASADAAVSFSFGHRGVKNELGQVITGNSAATWKGTILLYLDLDGDGFDNLPGNADIFQQQTAAVYTPNVDKDSFLWDADDFVMPGMKGFGQYASGTSQIQTIGSSNVRVENMPGFSTTASRWYTIFFNTPFTAGMTLPNNTYYTVVDHGLVGTTIGNKSVSALGTTANPFYYGPMTVHTVIPEPASIAMLLIGGGLMMARRRQA